MERNNSIDNDFSRFFSGSVPVGISTPSSMPQVFESNETQPLSQQINLISTPTSAFVAPAPLPPSSPVISPSSLLLQQQAVSAIALQQNTPGLQQASLQTQRSLILVRQTSNHEEVLQKNGVQKTQYVVVKNSPFIMEFALSATASMPGKPK